MPGSIHIVDPVTGAPLAAQTTLSGAYMLIARQIFTYPIPRANAQHSPFFREPFVLNAQSYCVGLSLITGVTLGQFHQVEVLGSVRSDSSAAIT